METLTIHRGQEVTGLETTFLVFIAATAVAGVAGQWLGWRFSIPAIIPLLILGAIAGPITGLVRSQTALGPMLRPEIGMIVAIIVFEGGLSLNFRELRTAAQGVLRLVFLALPLSWLFGTLAGHFLGGLSWRIALLFGAIIVVTGPTVILPLLRQTKLQPRANALLKWEGIVNDPIGATIALVVLSYLLQPKNGGSHTAIFHLISKTAVGALLAGALGTAVPFLLRALFHRDLAPEYLKSPILLASTFAIYASGEAIRPETGLVGATVFGIVLANINVTGLRELRQFKEVLTIFLVSSLFIILTANIDPHVLRSVSWPIAFTTLAVVFVVRPLAIYIATIGGQSTWQQRLLIGWIGPRGVVAAAVAGIAAEQLVQAGYPDGALILPMVFAVIASTVILHGLTLGPLARALGLASDAPAGLMIVGANPWSVGLAEALNTLQFPVLLADRSSFALRAARRRGLPILPVELLSSSGEETFDAHHIAYLLAATDDDAYNALLCTRFAPELGRERVHQLAPEGDEERSPGRDWRGKIAVDPELSFTRLTELNAGGYAFTAQVVEDSSEISAVSDGEGWPVVLVHPTHTLTFFSPDQPAPVSAGDTVLVYRRTQPQMVATTG